MTEEGPKNARTGWIQETGSIRATDWSESIIAHTRVSPWELDGVGPAGVGPGKLDCLSSMMRRKRLPHQRNAEFVRHDLHCGYHRRFVGQTDDIERLFIVSDY